MKRLSLMLLVILVFVSATTLYAEGTGNDSDKTFACPVDMTVDDYSELIEPDDEISWIGVCDNNVINLNINSIVFQDEIEAYIKPDITKLRKEVKKANSALKKTKSLKKKKGIISSLNKKYLSSINKVSKNIKSSFKKIWKKLITKNPKLKKAKLKKVVVTNNETIGFGLDNIKGAIDKKDWAKKRTDLKSMFKWDTEIWLKTMYPPDFKHKVKKQAEIRNTMIRIFGLLRFGGLAYRHNEKMGWFNFDYPTSSIISHGGRVLVAVKKAAKIDKRAVTNWLFTGKASGKSQKSNKVTNFKKRFASTHRTIFIKNRVEEEKLSIGKGLKKISLKKASNFSNNYAFNVPLSGYGSEGADGSPVRADGRFAHLLVILNDAKKTNKTWQTAFQIGVEGSEPIFFSKPYSPKGHLGTSHGLGSSEKMSVMNSPKFRDLAKKYKKLPANYNCMRIVIESAEEFKMVQKKVNKILSMKNLKQQRKAVETELLNHNPGETLEKDEEGMVEIDF